MTRVVLIALLAGGCAARAAERSGEFGEAALAREHFDELDSAVAHHAGERVAIQVQRNVGAESPLRGPAEVLTFPGILIGTSHQHVLLQSAPDDTAHIGKGNVVGIYLRSTDASPSTSGVVIGALVVGAAAAILTTESVSGAKVSDNSRRILVPAGIVLGGILGAFIGRDQRRGTLIYPVAHGRRPGPANP